MVTVPAISTPQVESRPVAPGYQDASGASLGAFGAHGARALQQGGQALSHTSDELFRTALRAQIEDNERQAKALDVEMSAAVRAATYGDGTPQNPGFYNMRGENAIAGHALAQKAVTEARQKLLQSAKNDRVREMFGDVSSKRLEHEFSTMDRFVGQERRRAADTVSEARMQEAAADAAKAWNDPAVLRRSIGVANGEVAAMAERNGWSPEVVKAKVQESNSLIVYAAAKSALAVENTGAAARIFKEYSGNLTAEVRTSLSKAIRDGSVAGAGQALAAQARALHPGDLTKQTEWILATAKGKAQDSALSHLGMVHNLLKAGERERLVGESQKIVDSIVSESSDPAEQRKAAMAIKEPDLRDAALRRIEHEQAVARGFESDRRQAFADAERFARNTDAKERQAAGDRENQISTEMYKAIDAGKEYESFPADVRASLSIQTQNWLKTWSDRKVRGEATETDWKYYDRIATMTDAEILATNPAEARTKLDEPRFNWFLRERENARDNKRDNVNPGSIYSLIQTKVNELKLSGPDNEKKRGQLRSAAENAIFAEQKATKAPLSVERKKEIIEAVSDSVVLVGRLYDGKSPLHQQAPPEVFKTVPPADVKKIVDSYQRQLRRSPSAQEIYDTYQRRLDSIKARTSGGATP